MGAAATAIAAATVDSANVVADQAKLTADQATETTDDAAAFAALTALGGTALYTETAADGTVSYFVATAVAPTGFTLTPIPLA